MLRLFHRTTLQCTRCQSRTHRRHVCDLEHTPTCARCSGTHETSDCAERMFRCAHCGGPHSAMPCEAKVLRSLSHKTGLPLPPYARQKSVNVPRSTLDERSYASAGNTPAKSSSSKQPDVQLDSEFPNLPRKAPPKKKCTIPPKRAQTHAPQRPRSRA